MKKSLTQEAMALAAGVLTQLVRTVSNAQLTYDCGVLQAGSLPAMVNGFPAVFEEARTAGATYNQIDRIRINVSALVPKGAPAVALQSFIVNLCLVELAQILAFTTFTSRADIDIALDAIDAAFAAAIETASNAFDAAVYQALISLNAACVQDLSNRAQTLPRIVFYEFPQPLSALYLAQRIYYDGSRAVELALENQTVHPLFVPSPVRALSA